MQSSELELVTAGVLSSDRTWLAKAITLVESSNSSDREKAIEYKNGKEKLFGFFVGQAMKVSGGKANPQLINEILKKKL